MNTQVLLKENAAKADEVARAVKATASALAETLEKKTGLVAEVIERQSDALVGAVGAKAGPLAKAVEVKADVLGEALEEKLELARKEALTTLKEFKFGQREALLLGVAVGVVAVVVISRRIDKQRAAERLRAAGSRAGESVRQIGAKVSESAQDLGAKVSPAVANVTSKAGELAGQVKQEVTTRAGELAGQSRPNNGRHEESELSEYALPNLPAAEASQAHDLDDARQRLAAEADQLPAREEAIDPQALGEGEPLAAASGELKVSNGMKVVAFDGTDIGRVQEVREEVFVLDRPRGADLLVPTDQVARIEGTVVYLRVDLGQVTKMGWEKADPE
jgi:hypothetical protein